MNRKHILVADDEAHTRLTLSLILKRAGFAVTAVEDGQQALDKALEKANQSEPFDLLVIDIQMPAMTGLELIRKIEDLNMRFPILLISGYRDRDILDALAGKGCIAFAEKPFNPDEFLGHVHRVLEMFDEKERRREGKRSSNPRKVNPSETQKENHGSVL